MRQLKVAGFLQEKSKENFQDLKALTEAIQLFESKIPAPLRANVSDTTTDEN